MCHVSLMVGVRTYQLGGKGPLLLGLGIGDAGPGFDRTSLQCILTLSHCFKVAIKFALCPCRQSNPCVLVMQAAENRSCLDTSYCCTARGSVCPCPGIDECGLHYSNRCSTTARGAGAAPQTRRRGQVIPGGSSRPDAPHSRSATVSVAMSDDRECQAIEGGG